MLSLLGFTSSDIKLAKFQDLNDFNTRKTVSEKLINNYPDRIPVIINSKTLILTKIKYLVPKDLQFSKFILQIRKNCSSVNSAQGIYLFTESSNLPCPSDLMINIYQKYKNQDQFLYFTITKENTFGEE